MKNQTKIINLYLLLFSFIAFAQVKIGDNPTTIGASSSLELESTNKALLLSRVANTTAISAPINGMLIYDVSASCIKAYQNGAWTACLGDNFPSLTGLTCASATFSPTTLTAGIAYSGTMTVPYTGGNGKTYLEGSAIASTGTTGLSATLVAGTLATGAGNLTYTITGTPAAAGSATFAITLGGQSCNVVSTVN